MITADTRGLLHIVTGCLLYALHVGFVSVAPREAFHRVIGAQNGRDFDRNLAADCRLVCPSGVPQKELGDSRHARFDGLAISILHADRRSAPHQFSDQ